MREDGFVLFEIVLKLVWLRALVKKSDGDRDSNIIFFITSPRCRAEQEYAFGYFQSK